MLSNRWLSVESRPHSPHDRTTMVRMPSSVPLAPEQPRRKFFRKRTHTKKSAEEETVSPQHSVLDETQIVAVQEELPHRELEEETIVVEEKRPILQRSFLECCVGPRPIEDFKVRHHHHIPDDPTVQESIECIFAATPLDWLEESRSMELVAPSQMQQSLLPSRSAPNLVRSPSGRQNREQRAPTSALPSVFPQSPLLLRATPNSGMHIRGIRYVDATDYLPHPSVALPINNGNEDRPLVTDFESPYFRGSLLIRLRHCKGVDQSEYDDDKGYFCGVNRRYQVVITGRFIQAMPWTSLWTGFVLERPCGKLPAKWLVQAALKVVSFFAPQLRVHMQGRNPHSLSPLGSTPQCLRVTDEDVELNGFQEEPRVANETLMGKASNANVSIQRARHRKKAFDKLVTHKDVSLLTDPDKVYTMEFLQHLLNFQTFEMDLGSMWGSVGLKEILDGQPLQIMACREGNHGEKLWSFDLWHEDLVEDAKKHGAL